MNYQVPSLVFEFLSEHPLPRTVALPCSHYPKDTHWLSELVGTSHSLGAQRCANPRFSPEEDQHLEEESRKHQKLPFIRCPMIVRILLALSASGIQILFLITQMYFNNIDLPRNNVNTKWIKCYLAKLCPLKIWINRWPNAWKKTYNVEMHTLRVLKLVQPESWMVSPTWIIKLGVTHFHPMSYNPPLVTLSCS